MTDEPRGFTGDLNSDDDEVRKRLIAEFLEHSHQVARLILSKEFGRKADRIRGEEDSESLALGALHDLLKNQKDWKSTPSFLAAVKTAIKRDCLDIIRRFQRSDDRQEVVDDFSSPDDHPAMVAFEDVLVAMREWNEDCYNVFVRRMFGCMSNVEIAEELGIDRGTVATRWKMALGWIAKQGYSVD